MSEAQAFVSDVCRLIETHIGQSSAKLYQDFYKDKDQSTIETSVRELLAEVIGESRASLELEPLTKKYHLQHKEAV